MYTPNERPMVISPEESRSLHEPTVFLDNPSAPDLIAAFAESSRQSPLVLDRYGALLAEAAERNGSRARTALETLILRGVVSRDPGSGAGPDGGRRRESLPPPPTRAPSPVSSRWTRPTVSCSGRS